MLDLQIQIRRLPKPVIAMVAGYAIGGGHVLHVCCDLTIAADNARFGQTGPRVGSFDAGYGINLLARQVGEKRAKEIWFLCRQYDAETALRWGLVNAVVGLDALEETTVEWARQMLTMSPLSLRLLKAGCECRHRRPGRRATARGRRHAPLLHDRGGTGGPGRLQAEARPRLLPVPEAPVSRPAPASKNRLEIWIAGARPRTLGAGLVPVLVGAAAVGGGDVVAVRGCAAGRPRAAGRRELANDYFDGVRGVDTSERIGPPRLTASGQPARARC